MTTSDAIRGRRFLVTGGGGFVGKALVLKLLKAGNEVISLSRSRYPDIEAAGARCEQVDISQSSYVWRTLFRGVDGVFHTAAKVQLWGAYESFFAVNVLGTRNVLEAAQSHNVPALVFTSSPSVIADGTNLRGVDESYPYPRHHHAHYPATKALSEREVLAANANTGIRTLALRPHLIWGPGDTNLVPTILNRARSGRLVRVGTGNNKVDLCYIDDCVRAHLLAMEALLTRPAEVGGQAYFISQGDPVFLWAWIDELLKLHGLPSVHKSIPVGVAHAVAFLCESMCRGLQLVGLDKEPLLTRLLVSEMSTDHYFSIQRAERDLGYRPQYTVHEAMKIAFGSA
jgi:2-alkyl-3-oxoalkanoate reductase